MCSGWSGGLRVGVGRLRAPRIDAAGQSHPITEEFTTENTEDTETRTPPAPSLESRVGAAHIECTLCPHVGPVHERESIIAHLDGLAVE